MKYKESYCSHPGCPRSCSRSPHAAVKFFKCLYLNNHSQTMHIWNITAWEGRLQFHKDRPLGLCPRVGLGIRTFVKCSIAVFKFIICLYLSIQLSVSIHFRNMGAWKGRLSVHRYRPLGSCPRVGLGFKIQDTSCKVFSAFLLCKDFKHILGNTSVNLVTLL